MTRRMRERVFCLCITHTHFHASAHSGNADCLVRDTAHRHQPEVVALSEFHRNCTTETHMGQQPQVDGGGGTARVVTSLLFVTSFVRSRGLTHPVLHFPPIVRYSPNKMGVVFRGDRQVTSLRPTRLNVFSAGVGKGTSDRQSSLHGSQVAGVKMCVLRFWDRTKNLFFFRELVERFFF